MRSISVFIMFLCLLGTMPTKAQEETSKGKAVVEVYYFHGTHRCPTCLAVEAQTRKVLEELYSKEMTEGTIELKVLNLEEKDNKEMVERFEIGWSSLILYKPGTKESVNLTEEGFATARTDAETFRSTLKKNLDKLIG